jgi:hypothetical protein
MRRDVFRRLLESLRLCLGRLCLIALGLTGGEPVALAGDQAAQPPSRAAALAAEREA